MKAKMSKDQKKQNTNSEIKLNTYKSGERIPRPCSNNKQFLSTLWTICEDPVCDDVISWDPEDKCAFVIRQPEKLKNETLPKYYAAKWHSFRRQLYFYGFKGTRDVVWRHPHLDHTVAESFDNIKRVKSGTKRRMDDLYANFGMFPPMFAPFSNQMFTPFSSSGSSPPTSMMQGFVPGYSPTNATMRHNPMNPHNSHLHQNNADLGKFPPSLTNFLPKPIDSKVQPLVSPTLMVPNMPSMMPMMPVMSPVYISPPNVGMPQFKKLKTEENSIGMNIEARDAHMDPKNRSDLLKSKSVETELRANQMGYRIPPTSSLPNNMSPSIEVKQEDKKN